MKKGLLFASLASVTAVAGGLAFAVANANKGIRYEAAKATAKSFRLDSSSEIAGISGQTFSIPSSIPKQFSFSGYEGYSEGNSIECKSRPSDTNQLSFCVDEGYFISFKNGSGKSYAASFEPSVYFEFGINNLTSITIKTKYSLVSGSSHIGHRVYFYNGNEELGGDPAYTHYSDSAKTWNVNELGFEKQVNRVVIQTVADDGWGLTDGDIYGFEYIEGTWSC